MDEGLNDEIIGFSFKNLSHGQQKKLLLEEIGKSMKEIKKGAPFTHFLRYVYDAEVAQAVTLELSQSLGQEGQYFPGEPPTQIAWIEFAGNPL